MKERIINYAIRFYKWIQSNAVFANVCIWGSNLAIDIFTFLLRKKGCLSVIILCIQILGIAFTFWLYKIGKKRQCLDNAKWDKNEEVHRALYDSIDDLTEKEQRQAQINKRTLSDHDRYIDLDNGWTITLGRGLDIFEKVGRFSLDSMNQGERRCKEFNVTYNRKD